MAGVKFDIGGNANGIIQATRQAEAAVGKMTKNVTNEGKALDDMFKKLAGTVATLGAGLSATALTKQIFDIRSEFQQLEIAFGTMLKSKEKANELMKDAAEFAATTPFDLKGVAAGIKQNLAYGASVDTVIDEMRMLGDVAAGVSMPLNDLVYLYGTLRTSGKVATIDIRQFAGRGIPIYEELAKVLGVAKNEVAGLVTAGKVGFADIEKAFKNMTSAGGMFNNLMADQSKSLGGQYSNLKDNIEMMFNDIGKSQENVFSNAMGLASKLVENYETVGRALAVLVATYGAYKAAIIAVAAVEKAQVAASAIKKFVELTKVMNTATAAQKAFNGAALANPYILAATVLTALISGVIAFTKHKKAEVAAQKEASREVGKEVSEVNLLASKLKDANVKENERVKALERLKEIAPEVVEGINAESMSLEALNANLEEYNTLKSVEITLKASTEYLDFNEAIESFKEAKSKMEQEKANIANVWIDFSSKIVAAIKSGEVSDDLAKYFNSFIYDPTIEVYDKVQKVRNAALHMGQDLSRNDNSFIKGLFWDSRKDVSDFAISVNNLTVLENEYANALQNIKTRIHDTVAQFYTDAKEVEKVEGIMLKALGLSSDGGTVNGTGGTDQKVLTEKQKEELYKRQQAEKKAAESLAKLKKQLNDKIAKADLDSMDEGYAKSLSSLEYNLQKELDAITEQKEQLLKSKREEALKSWLAEDPEGRKEYQFVYKEELTPEEEQIFKEMGEQAQAEFNKGREKVEKQFRKEAGFLMKQFEIDAMSAGKEKEKAQKDLDNEKELHALEMQRDAYIEAAKAVHIFAEERKAASDPAYKIQDFNEEAANAGFDQIVEATKFRQSADELKALQLKYEDFAQAKKRIDEELQSEISKMKDKDGNLVAGFTQENVDNAVRQAEELKDSLAVQYSELDEDFQVFVASLADKTLKQLTTMLAQSEIELEFLEALGDSDPDDLARARAEVAKLKEQLKKLRIDKGTKEATTNWTELNRVLAESASIFTEIGETIPGVAGQLISGIGSIASSTIGMANGIKAIGTAVTAVEKASAILAVISAAMKIVQKFVNLAEENKKANEKAAKSARDYAEALNDLNESAQIDKNNTIFGDDSLGALVAQSEKAKNNFLAIKDVLEKGVALYEEIKNTVDTSWINVNTGGVGQDGFSDLNVFSPEQMTDEFVKGQLNSQRYGYTLASDLRTGWQKFWGIDKNKSTFDLSSLYNKGGDTFSFMDFINEDKFEEFAEWYKAWGDGVSDENKVIVDQLLADWEDYKEAIEQIKQGVKSFFSDITSNVSDSMLNNWIETGEAIADATELVGDYGKALAKSAVESYLLKKVFADAEGQMLELMMAGNYKGAASLISNLINEANSYAPAIADMFEQINIATGGALKEMSSTRTSVEKGITQASQDSVDELNGRATAIQSHTFSINERVGNLVSITNQILTAVRGVETNTSRLEQIEDSLSMMESNISDIVTKGIKVKA